MVIHWHIGMVWFVGQNTSGSVTTFEVVVFWLVFEVSLVARGLLDSVQNLSPPMLGRSEYSPGQGQQQGVLSGDCLCPWICPPAPPDLLAGIVFWTNWAGRDVLLG